MKQKLQKNWPWLIATVAVGLACATYLLAQIGGGDSSTPAEVGNDAEQLVGSLAVGDYQIALEILRQHGVAEDTLLAMAQRLGRTPTRVNLGEPFLNGVVSLSLKGREGDIQARLNTARALGHERVYWVAQALDGDWIARCDLELSHCPVPPIGVLNAKPGDTNLIEFFKWFDRYAEHLHSLVLNGEDLSNHEVMSDYAAVNFQLSGLYKLLKARKPDMFIWLGVVKKDDLSDEDWLRAMDFRPDGLQIWNLRQFHSPFEQTSRRYLPIVGADMPMMVAGFYGYKTELQSVGKELSAAKKIEAPNEREAAIQRAKARLAAIGRIVGSDLNREEQRLQTLGYCGLSAHWLLLEAIEQANGQPGE